MLIKPKLGLLIQDGNNPILIIITAAPSPSYGYKDGLAFSWLSKEGMQFYGDEALPTDAVYTDVFIEEM